MIEKINVLNDKEKEKVVIIEIVNEILNALFLMKFLQRSISKTWKVNFLNCISKLEIFFY